MLRINHKINIEADMSERVTQTYTLTRWYRLGVLPRTIAYPLFFESEVKIDSLRAVAPCCSHSLCPATLRASCLQTHPHRIKSQQLLVPNQDPWDTFRQRRTWEGEKKVQAVLLSWNHNMYDLFHINPYHAKVITRLIDNRIYSYNIILHLCL